jgi:hypothetical protein
LVHNANVCYRSDAVDFVDFVLLLPMMCRTRQKLPYLEEEQMADLIDAVGMLRSEKAKIFFEIITTYECDGVIYSHLQNRLRPLSPKRVLSTDHISHFWR